MIKTIDYINNNINIIPIDNNKKPLIKWKYFQTYKTTEENIYNWNKQFGKYNIGIVTGKVSNLTVIDVDDVNNVDNIISNNPEIANTAIVKTKRGYHFYLQGVTNSYNTDQYEIKSEGSFVVAPESYINEHKYIFISPLNKIKPLPESYKKETKNNDIIKINWVYSGKNYDCIGQILTRDLLPGERDLSLFILFNLLLKHNTYNYSMKLVNYKNNILKYPLPVKDFNKILRKKYNYGCKGIRNKLDYIDCEYCNKFRVDMKKDDNIINKNINKIKQLNNSERGMLLALATMIDNNYTINKISEVTKMNYQTVKKLIDDMKAKGIEF